MDSGIEVPPDQQDALAGLEHRLLHEVEIGFGIDDHWIGDGVNGWRDTNVRLQGPVVDQLLAFRERVGPFAGGKVQVTPLEIAEHQHVARPVAGGSGYRIEQRRGLRIAFECFVDRFVLFVRAS